MHNELHAAIAAGDRAEVERVVATLDDEHRLAALFHYCDRDNEAAWDCDEPVEAVRMLLDAGCVPDRDDPLHHLTPLHIAAWHGYADIVDALLEHGAPFDMRDDEWSGTPLQWTVTCCAQQRRRPRATYPRIVRRLLDLGAGWSAAKYPFGDEEIDAIFAPLAAERLDAVVAAGDRDLLEKMLAGGPSQNDLDLALLAAAELGQPDVCTRLMQAGAVVCVPEGTGWTALNAAVWSGSVDTLEAVLAGGADVETPNLRGGTIWHGLGECGATREMIDVAVKYGALPIINRASKFRYTPLDLAILEKHTDTIAYMRELGAETGRETMPEG